MTANHEDPEVFLRQVTQLATRALEEWDLAVTGVSPIKVRENAVFRLDLADGSRRVLRVHRLGYHSDQALESEFAWMQALAESGIAVPRAVPSRRGRAFERVEGGGLAGARQVDIFEWIEGRQLGESGGAVAGTPETVAQQYATIGSVMARMHNQAAAWTRPPGFRRHAWDADGLLGEAPLWGRFWELEALSAGQRDLLLRTREVARAALAELGQGADRYGLIHADLVPENLLVEGTHVRVIDFDDAGDGWHLFDIATSLYFLTPDPLYPVAEQALIGGYRSERALPDTVLRHLPAVMAARATTYLGWVHTRRGTQTAIELTPFLVDLACTTAERCLRARAD